LTPKPKIVNSEKTTLHPRNLHRQPYDFAALCLCYPELSAFVLLSKGNQKTIDFANPEAVKSLNKALLKFFYHIDAWDIPQNYLCPPIPGRSDYIHYMADLLCESNGGTLPDGKSITVADIGSGANCIYPILGNSLYGWKFIGSDIDPVALESANRIINATTSLQKNITCRLQKNSENILTDLLQSNEVVDMTICNPPFHASLEEALSGTERKWKNLGVEKNKKSILNFGGQNNELWCKGGENAFVCKMAEQSLTLRNRCFWFSTLISKKTTLPSIYYMLEKAKAVEVKTIDMAQGQKISRIVAWTFLTKGQQEEWKRERWN
jgi:23S rRNA (adenine1618-N6)-methyltransferase